jgi:hypothetical protein
MESGSKVYLPSLGMLIISGGGALISLTSAAGLILAGLITWLGSNIEESGAHLLLSFGWASALQFLLLLPATVFAILRLIDVSFPVWNSRKAYGFSVAGLVLVPITIAIGSRLTQEPRLAELILPVLQLFVIGLPLVWLLAMGTRGFPAGTSQRGWNIFSFSSVISIPIILVVEMVIILGLVAAGFAWLGFFLPDLLQQMGHTIERLVNVQSDLESIIRILRPYINQPLVFAGGLALTAGIIPIMEELLKPMALWFFAGRPLSPREGFTGGLICGASFALLESLGAMANPTMETWPLIAIGRIGTGILHMGTTALVGWGLGKAWSEEKYGSLAGAFIAAVGFHSVWNIFGLMTGLSEISEMLNIQSEIVRRMITISPFVLILLSGLLISIIHRGNLVLRLKEK